MEPNLVDCVIHWKKKLEKYADNEDVILNVIRKLSKIKMTLEILQTTQIGKSIRNLSKRSDTVGERAKALLNKWKTIVNLESSKSSKHKSSSNKNNVEESSLHQKEKHREKSLHHSSSKQSSNKPLNVSSSSISNQSLGETKLKNLSLNDEDFDYNFQAGYSDDKNVEEETLQLHTPSSLKRKLTTEQLSEACKSSLPKKHKSDKYMSSGTEEKKKHSIPGSKEYSPSVKKEKCESKYEGTKSAKQNSSLHSKKVKRDDLKTKNASFYPAESEISKPVLDFPSPEEEFSPQNMSFEDCLGFNDIVTVKKKKSSKSQPSAKKTSDSVHAKYKLDDKKSTIDSSPSDVHVSTKSSSLHSSKGKQSASTSKTSTVADSSKTNSSFFSPTQTSFKLSPSQGFHSSKKEVISNEDVIKFTSSRKEKTAIYSGKRNNNRTIPTLAHCCYRVLIENIDFLGDMGDTPYSLLKPILEKCTANQLFTIEKYNPYLLDDTNELWEIHCKRDYKFLSPLEHETWRDVYLRGFDEQEEKLKNITANISASMLKAKPVRQVKCVYMDMESHVKPPRDVLRRQAKHGLLDNSGSGLKPAFSSKAVAKKLVSISASSTSNKTVVDGKKESVKKNVSLPSELPSVQSVAKPIPPVDVSPADKDIMANISRVQKKPKTVPPLMAKVLKTAKQCFRR